LGTRLDEALAGLAEERRRLDELHEKIATSSTVVHSKDRVLSVTVDGRGELSKIAFDGTRYRRLAPAELAKLITDTVAAARREAIGKISGMAGDIVPGVSFEDVAMGKLDVRTMVDSFLGAAIESLPDRMRDRARTRLEGRI